MPLDRRRVTGPLKPTGRVDETTGLTETQVLGRGGPAPSDKLNIAALGNLVPQLHVHVIARRASDAAWPRPVWGVLPPLAHDAEEVQNFISALRRKIWLG